jgi:hypothetical protein
MVCTIVKDHDALTVRITQSKKNFSGTAHPTTQLKIPEDFLLVKQSDILKSVCVADSDLMLLKAETAMIEVF